MEAPPAPADAAGCERHRPFDACTPARRAGGCLALALRGRVSDVIIEAQTSAAALMAMEAHPGLDTFRPPQAQLAALIAIAQEPFGSVATARDSGKNQLVGYAAFHRPSAVETWGEDRTGQLIELGAVEVAP